MSGPVIVIVAFFAAIFAEEMINAALIWHRNNIAHKERMKALELKQRAEALNATEEEETP